MKELNFEYNGLKINSHAKKTRAAIVALSKNDEIYQIARTMEQIEDRFNGKFQYDWVFFNNEEFTPQFKNLTSAMASGKVKFGVIPKKFWSYPDWIDQDKAAETRKKMGEQGIRYGDLESYRHMCRFKAGLMFQMEELKEYDWYWLVEPRVDFTCNIDYDVFEFMEKNNKLYGFSIAFSEMMETVETFWDSSMEFLKKHPDAKDKESFFEFLTDDNGKTYNGNHYWSNFEVGDLNFFRSNAYMKYFDYMDRAGGFYYERWGDGPLHTFAASTFIPRDKLHFFDDIGYKHEAWETCPISEKHRLKQKCSCDPRSDYRVGGPKPWIDYYNLMGMEYPDFGKV
ncbi:uncharacterized protein J8A68_004912 [[Candida] subhashii]|uniref:Mannosyltransferase n=1 Tax=[Candida] subhashii TaxID=561895 RepID=A0A8J5QGG3_9ASCO|nr:uncharacterized protein J8A68_004912 [[Candida] subhashii]KAG7661543.1 hypothetical protein J8A68_004912 [[Candida] subhashii]